MEAGGWVNGYTGDGQAANRKCTTHTRHRTQVRTQVPVGLPNRSNGGCRLLPKWAKKHSIAADCGELKATFGPHLRCAAVQQVKQ